MMRTCKYCGKEINNKGSLVSHELRCLLNENRVVFQINYAQRNTSNQFIKARQEDAEIPVSKCKGRPGKKGYRHTEEFKIKQRDNAIRRCAGGVRKSRRINYNGKILGSSYEYKIAVDLDFHGVRWEVGKRLKYVDPTGKHRTYTPDFYLPEYDVFLDPKNDFLINNVNPALGFSDKEKINLVMEQNNIKVIILDKYNLTWGSIQKLLTSV